MIFDSYDFGASLVLSNNFDRDNQGNLVNNDYVNAVFLETWMLLAFILSKKKKMKNMSFRLDKWRSEAIETIL